MNAHLSLAKVLAHCGGDLDSAAALVGRAIATRPAEPIPYTVVAEMGATAFGNPQYSGEYAALAYLRYLAGDHDAAVGSLGRAAGAQPEVAWADAPWFGDPAVAASVGAVTFGEAASAIANRGPKLAGRAYAAPLAPWLRLVDTVAARADADPEAVAKMARLMRACGRMDASFALCDRADAIAPVMLTEVMRAGNYRVLGDHERMTAAFERALALDPSNWSLFLDLADAAAGRGDFAAALAYVERGLAEEPDEPDLRAARAAFRTRLTGSAQDRADLEALAGSVNPGYHAWLRDQAGTA